MNNSTEIYYSPHMSTGQAHPSQQPVTSGPLTHYSHAQPPLLPPSHTYSNGPSYSHGYYGSLASPSAHPVAGPMAGPSSVLPLPGVAAGPMPPHYAGFDTTGQLAPPGAKPRVTATLWEDEGSLCFQVETRGICVARREDNHMINGTKLLNVAGMTRGRRDGILKSEKTRHVVKIGPMHLKGVWIPFDRALDFANKEKITESLYPLFVHNISALLYHPSNATARGAAGGPDRQRAAGTSVPSPLPSLGAPHPHHHMQALPAPPPPSTGPTGSSAPPVATPGAAHMSAARPGIDRSHTFPTPPTSAVMDGMSSGSYPWPPHGSMNGNQHAIDSSLASARSMPTTPVSTPPTHGVMTMTPYGSATQGYDNGRSMYGAPATQPSRFAPHLSHDRGASVYGHQDPYPKTETLGPAPRGAGPDGADADSTKPTGAILPSNGTASGAANPGANGDEDSEHDQDSAEYTHNSGEYDSARGGAPAYNYAPPPVVDHTHPHMAGELTSPGHGVGSGRATPRTTAQAAGYYSQPSGYGSPTGRGAQPGSVYSVMNDRVPASASAATADVYGPPSGLPGGGGVYSSQLAGVTSSLKRRRDDDDADADADEGRSGAEPSGDGYHKRRRTLESGVAAPTIKSSGLTAHMRR